MISVDKLQADPGNVVFQDPLASRQAGLNTLQNKNPPISNLDLSSGILSADKTQKILEHELIGKLEERFKLEGIDTDKLRGLNPDDFTPDKVAGRILKFIELGISRAGDDEEKQKMLGQARKGVEQGFKDAREILDAIGVLQGKVKEDIDKTYDLIQAGFDRLGKPIIDEDEKQKEDKLKLIEQAGFASTQSEESRSTSVEIMTRDGDKVTINLSREESRSGTQFYANDGNQSVYGESSSSSSYTNIHYQVDGDLDEGEKAAIDDLLNQLNGVAKEFYQGNIDAAFNRAKELGFNSDELAQFSVDMSHQQTNQVAVISYQNAQKESDSQQQNLDQHSSVIKEVTDFMNHIDRLLKDNAFDLFADNNKSMLDILNASMSLQNDQSEKEQPTAFQSLNEMIKSLQGAEKNPLI